MRDRICEIGTERRERKWRERERTEKKTIVMVAACRFELRVIFGAKLLISSFFFFFG